MPVSGVQEALQLPESYSNGTVFFARYEAQIVEGECLSDDSYGFGYDNWQARGVDDAEIATVTIYQQPELDNCEVFGTITSDMEAKLAEGSQISACSVFASIDPVNLAGVRQAWTKPDRVKLALSTTVKPLNWGVIHRVSP